MYSTDLEVTSVIVMLIYLISLTYYDILSRGKSLLESCLES